MRKLILAGLLLSAILSLNAADFRNATWGMTAAQVKKAETSHLEESSDDQLDFSAVLDSQPVLISYYFENGALVGGGYRFTQEHRETQKYIEDYQGLQEQLVKKYGAPASENRLCDDPFYSDYPRRWGTAVVVGKMTLSSSWNTPKLVLTHSMRVLPGGNVGHEVQYHPAAPARSSFGGKELLGAL
jgi:hypothetical protein